MANPRRDLETRESEMRISDLYTPPSLLPAPIPDADWVYRYVAVSVLGQADPAHVSKRMREGWEPVKAEDHPELQLAGNKNGNVELGGLLLCKMPRNKAKARDAYYAEQTAQQMSSVDNHFMKNNDPRMPLFKDSRTEVKRGFGSGTK